MTDATETKTVAGESQARQSSKGKIIEYGFWLQKEGFAEATISRRIRLFETLSKRGTNILDPESVKEGIARQNTWGLKTKVLAVDGYTNFLKMEGQTWQPPHYRPIRKLPYIPTEQEINDLIASCNKKTATFLQVLKETGARCGEAWQLKWIDLNPESRALSIIPEKGSEPRQLKISNKLLSMLNSLANDEPVIFKGTMKSFVRGFRRQRKKTAIKLKSDRIGKITFHTFRHWKATMEYHDTKDIWHVMKMLGH